MKVIRKALFWVVIGVSGSWQIGTSIAGPSGVIGPDWAVAASPASNNQTLDDCIRNPACGRRLAVGHRGTIVWAPENTIAAFDAALQMGADAVEMDVRRTRDDVLILMHDATLDRTTDCSGQVAQKTWAELQQCAVQAVLPGIPTEKIPTFRDALVWLKGRTVIDVDVKDPTLLVDVASAIEAEGMQNQVMVLTKTIQAANALSDRGIAVLALANNANAVSAALALQKKPVAVEVDIKLLASVSNQIHKAGLRVFVDALEGCDLVGVTCYRRVVRSGADLIQTDRLPVLVPFLNSVNP